MSPTPRSSTVVLFLLVFAFAAAFGRGAEAFARFGSSGPVTVIRARTRTGSLERTGDSVRVGLRDGIGGVLWVIFEGEDGVGEHRNQFQVTVAGADARYLEPKSPEETALLGLLQAASTNTYGTSNPELLLPLQLEDDVDYSRLGMASIFSSTASRNVHPAAGPSSSAQPPDRLTLKAFLGGPKSVAIVTNGTEASVFRIIDKPLASRRKRAASVDGFSCDPQPAKVKGGTVRNALLALCEIRNFGADPKRSFDPEVLFRFISPTGSLDVAVCFDCSELSLFRDGNPVVFDARGVAGKNSFGADARSAFVALAKAAFPGDVGIRKLKGP